MTKKLYDEASIMEIANAIREQLYGSTVTMKVSEMPSYIRQINVVPLSYGNVITSVETANLSSNQTVQIGIKLDSEPSMDQKVYIGTSSSIISLDEDELTFTPSNYNTYQYVSATADVIDSDDIQYINITNGDREQTESTLTVYLTGLKYSDVVNTTIPSEGMHTVTADDFTSTSVSGNLIRLYGYKAEYTNIYVPATINGKTPWICSTTTSASTSNTSFHGNTTIQYVTFEDGVVFRRANQSSGTTIEGIFGGCTNLIGVSNISTAVTSMASAFSGCTSLKFVDNLNELVNVTNDNQSFYGCTALEYVQDLTGWTKVGLQRTFRDCSNLKKIFGLPQPATSGATFEYAFLGTKVTEIDIPVNAGSLVYCFNNCSTIKTIRIYENAVTTTNLNKFTNTSQKIDIYANSGSTTLASLNSKYASSSTVTIRTLDGGASLPLIVVWGDSTSSPGKTWVEWPKRLQTKLGTSEYLVKNEAVSGEWTTSTSARQGGNAIHTNAFTIPTTTESVGVTLTTADNQTFSSSPVFSKGGSWNPCIIDNVEGTIGSSGGQYTFSRATTGEAVSVASGTYVTSKNDDKFNNEDNIMLIQLGHNKGWGTNPNTLLNQIQLMVDHFEDCGGTKYIITGPWSGSWIYSDSGWAVTQQFNTLASQAFGSHYFNLPQEIADHCQVDNPNWEPTSEDLTLISEGKTPRSLTSDNTHPTAEGSNSMMMAYYRKGVELGYWE